jgi:predicted ATPase
MIERITIENFKSLKNVDLRLGRLNLFIGTNASGKSNFFDALRVLQGIGYGFTLPEILDGKHKSATSEVWEPIRGGSANALYKGAVTDANSERLMRFTVKLGRTTEQSGKEYQIGLSAERGWVREERLTASDDIYTSLVAHNPLQAPVLKVRYYSERKSGRAPEPEFEKMRAVLHQLPLHPKFSKKHAPILSDAIRRLSDMQRVDPAPALLRGYSQAHSIQRMGERGENFAALIRTICSDATAKAAYLGWLRELRPAEVEDVDTLPGAVQEPLFALRERGNTFPATVLSDGTLRFAAIAAAFFQPDIPGLMTIEEIENGIHASRLRLLVELLRSQSAQGKAQVLATTHSPIVLAWLKPEEFAHTFFCKRDEETGESRILPLTEVPRFKEVVSKTPIGDLFAEGWLESAL